MLARQSCEAFKTTSCRKGTPHADVNENVLQDVILAIIIICFFIKTTSGNLTLPRVVTDYVNAVRLSVTAATRDFGVQGHVLCTFGVTTLLQTFSSSGKLAKTCVFGEHRNVIRTYTIICIVVAGHYFQIRARFSLKGIQFLSFISIGLLQRLRFKDEAVGTLTLCCYQSQQECKYVGNYAKTFFMKISREMKTIKV